MIDALGLIRGLATAGLTSVRSSRLTPLAAVKDYEQKILNILRQDLPSEVPETEATPDIHPATSPVSPADGTRTAAKKPEVQATRKLGINARERRVPSSQIGRVLGFAGLGANLAYGAVSSLFDADRSRGLMNERNAEVLAASLCRMRGAALKLGQMLSIQDETVIPPYLQTALDRVRSGADYMPRHQLERVLRAELGDNWKDSFDDFDLVPMAAASIGQVHRAVLKDGRSVAMKIQYPGVAKSIESDLNNLITLMKVTDLLPKGLYVDTLVRVMRKELALECDYEHELQSQQKFKALIEGDEYCSGRFHVPEVFPDLSTKQVLTTEWASGMTIDGVKDLSQRVRNEVGEKLLHLTMKELFIWRFMQTDPNWGNFLYDESSGVLTLLDFGAARPFPKSFTDEYLRMVAACADRDRDRVIQSSIKLGFLTGDENDAMLDAHCEAGFIVGTPFSREGPYDFSQHAKLTARVTELGGVMLKNRLCPPPEESYSLHRKLSGAFLCCIKLKSVIPSRRMFHDVYEGHDFSPEIL